MRLLFIFFVFFLSACSKERVEGDVKVNLNIMEVMADAPYREINYRALINFNNALPAQFVTPYLYDQKNNELRALKKLKLNREQKIDLDFDYENSDSLYLVFLLEDVGFRFNDIRPAQFICFVPVKNEYIAEVVECNFATTALYLMAYNNEANSLVDIDSLSTWFNYLDDEMLDNQTIQNFTAMYSVAMTYLTRNPKHISLDMVNTGFIKVFSFALQDYMHRISSRFSADITSFEKRLSNLSNGFNDFGYKVDKDKTLLFETAFKGLPLVETHSVYLNDFFSGENDINFINKIVYRLSLLSYDKDSKTLSWETWPWVDHVRISIDGNEIILKKNQFILPEKFKSVVITPYGTKGKFVSSTLSFDSILGLSR